MSHVVIAPPAAPPARRPAYRPPLGLPLRRESRWGTVVSVLLHALVILFVLAPLFQHDVALVATRGGGGPGPVGGGGGGNRGSGGQPREEHIRYFTVAAPAPTPLVTPKPAVPKPPAPVVPPQPVVPQIAKVDEHVDSTPPPTAIAPVAGVGGGTGNDGTRGTGPGTGGGIGTGVGTGTGSGEGPGTGGAGVGDTAIATNYFADIPMEHPKSVAGKSITIHFALDDAGRIMRVEFESTGSRSFDKELREHFMNWKFRPAFLRSSGTPVPSVYPTTVSF
jgi:protein TonB